MNKKELKNKLENFAKHSKSSSIKIASYLKKKAQGFCVSLKNLSQKLKLGNNKNKPKPLHIYDDKDKELKTSSSTFTIKPMSAKAAKVSMARSLFSSFRVLKFSSLFYFCSFTKKVLFLGSAFVSAWLLGLSFDIKAQAFCAFLAFFLIALTIRYIKTVFGSLVYGLLTGFFANIFILNWIFDTVLYGTGNCLLAAGSLFALAALLALPMMLFSFFAWQYKHKLFLYPFASACAWVALELIVQLISYKAMGFAWFVLGYTQYANLELIQISSILGVYGLSFFIIFCSFSLSLILGKEVDIKTRLLNFLSLVSAVAIFIGYGQIKLAEYQDPSNSKTLKAAIIQPNTHKAMLDGDILQVNQTLNDIALVLEKDKNLNLIVWPESTLPGYLEEGPLNNFMSRVSNSTKAAQIAGGSAISAQQQNKENKKQEKALPKQEFVAAGLYNEGSLISQHHKRKLVPFGEFLPFQKHLKDFYEKNAISSLTGSFVEGRGSAQILVLPGKEETFFGAQICFESIFPILWRLEVLGGAEFFVNLSNDGWFLNTAAPYQHLRINVFRAVENRRPILRSANSGISAYINNFGKIEYSSNLNEQDIKMVELFLPLNPQKTFYTVYGDIFGFLCIFLTLLFSYNCLDILQEND